MSKLPSIQNTKENGGDSRQKNGYNIRRIRTEINLEHVAHSATELRVLQNEQSDDEGEEQRAGEEDEYEGESNFEDETGEEDEQEAGKQEEERPMKVKKCKKKREDRKQKNKEQKGEGDEWGESEEDDGEEEDGEEEDGEEEGWEEWKEIEEAAGGERIGEALLEERAKNDEDELEEEEAADEWGEESSEENSEEYTTCSESEEEGPRWDDLAEDELGFLLLTDPGIYEALQLREKDKVFRPDGMDAYLALCKAFGITPIKSFLQQLFTDTVDLKFYGASAKNIRSLAQALKYNPYVKTLDLTETPMDEAAVYEIAELIRENSTLKTVRLRKCKIGPEGARYLADTLDLSVTLENLDLSANGLGDEGIEILAPAIGRNTALKSLDLSYNRIGQKGAKALGTALKENETLSKLTLRWNNLYEDAEKGLKVLLSALSRPEIPVERLDLAWNALGETSAPFVRSFMVKAPLLREILLDHNRFPDAGALAIKRGLAKAPVLEVFRMGFNPMTSDAAHGLLAAAQPRLKVLDLDGICVKKNFLSLKLKKLKDLELELIHGEALSAYVIQPVDMAKLMLSRARFEGLKPKKKKKKKDFGHLLLEFDLDRIRILEPDDFIRRIRAKKMKIREELVRGIMDLYKNKRGRVNVEHMLDKYMELFPDTQLPPPKPKKEKKKKKTKKGKKK